MLLCLTLPVYLGSAGSNSGTHALKQSTVLPEPSSQPPPQYLYKYFFQNISPFKNTKASDLFDLNKTQKGGRNGDKMDALAQSYESS